MAVEKMPYQDLNHALRLLRKQVMEGVPYAQTELPKFNSPEQVFSWLKLRTTYKHDPKGTELFQTLPTLLDDNYHGLTGSGDCDCFTIAALTILLANGFHNCGIVLVGRKSWQPVHIYAYVVDDGGQRKYLDLTNRVYNYERSYPYKQHIQFKLNQKEKNNMMLQLADADDMYNGYIWMPSQNINLREDMLDELDDDTFTNQLLSEGYPMDEIVELSGRRDRRIKRKEAREKRKADRSERKNKRTESKARAREARAEGKRLRGEGRLRKGENAGGDDWKSALTTVTDTAGNLIGKWKGTERVPDDTTDDYSVTDQVNGVSNKRVTSGNAETVSILGMEMSKQVAIAGGIGLAALIGFGIYKATRPKRRAA